MIIICGEKKILFLASFYFPTVHNMHCCTKRDFITVLEINQKHVSADEDIEKAAT